MSSEAIAAIVAAFITATGTIVATRFNEIVDLFHAPLRRIDGHWEGETYNPNLSPIDDTKYEQRRPPDMKYFADLKQSGSTVRGQMEMTKARPGRVLYKHNYRGHIEGTYFVYELFTNKPEQFRYSVAMLHIHDSGRMMRGYFVASTGGEDSKQTYFGYTVMHKIG